MKNYRFSSSLLPYTAAVMLLVPALRLFPTASAQAAGEAAWLSAPAALPLLLGYALFLDRFMSRRRNSEGLAELIRFSVGRLPLAVTGLWLLLYTGFVLRSGADRFITTVYPGSSPQFFCIVMGLAALISALGSAKRIAGASKLGFPFMFGTLIFILLVAFVSIRAENLFPVRLQDTVPILHGAVSAVDVSVCVMYAVCFLESDTDKEEGRAKSYILWAIFIVIFLAVLTADIIGNFGAGLVKRLTRPFFSMVRNLVFFRTLERMEALVVALWVFPDFITVSVFLYSAQYCLRLALNYEPKYSGERGLELSNGRYIIWLCAAGAIFLSLFMARDEAALTLWSQNLIPKLNMLFALFFLPAVYITGRRRGVY